MTKRGMGQRTRFLPSCPPQSYRPGQLGKGSLCVVVMFSEISDLTPSSCSPYIRGVSEG